MDARTTLPRALRAALEGPTPKSLKDLSVELGVSEKLLPDALEKLSKTLKNSEQRLHRDAARCQSCGFTFDERQRVATPGRCPRCRSERISAARFWIT